MTVQPTTTFSATSPMTPDSGVSWLAALESALSSPNPPTNMPALPISVTAANGQSMPLGGFAYSAILSFRLSRWIISQVAAKLPQATADAMTNKFARRNVRANASFNMTSPVVAPGAVSANVSLVIDNQIAGALLLDIVCDTEDSKLFNCPTFSIGVSNLVPATATLAPASALAGIALGVWDCEGAEYNDVSPEFGIVYRTGNGQPITVNATFAHKRPFGPLAYAAQASVSLLCLVDTLPKTQACGMSAQEIAATIAEFESCRV